MAIISAPNALWCSLASGLMACSIFEPASVIRESPSPEEETQPEENQPGEAQPEEPKSEKPQTENPNLPPVEKTDEPEPGSALLLSPRHGQVVGGTTALLPIVVAGKSPSPEQPIEVQLLTVPTNLASWQTIATTSSNAESNGDPDLGFTWSVAIPPELRAPESWPQGGLLRMRVVAGGQPTAILSHDADACIAQTQSTEGARELACASRKENGIVLVSPAPSEAQFPPYLARKGIGSISATQLYYQQTDAPATYQEFMARYIDGATPTSRAIYLNTGDLAVGRNIECAEFPDGNLTGVACMTGNFGAFSGDLGISLSTAIAGHEAGDAQGAFAYVAMVYQPSRGLDNTVSFVVFGADGARIDAAALDTRGDVAAIPNTCLNCHGSGSSFDPINGIARGASFLPLDALQMAFPLANDFTLAAQSEEIRKLNQMVSLTGLNNSSQAVLDEMYPGGVDQPGALMYPSDTPASWAASSRSAETYRNVIAPSCRGCHMTGTLDFSTESLFRTTGQGAVQSVCGDHSMPNAEVVVRNFWAGPGRAYLVDFFDVADPCKPPAL